MGYTDGEYVLLCHYIRNAASLWRYLLFVSPCLYKQQLLNCPSESGWVIFHLQIKGDPELILWLNSTVFCETFFCLSSISWMGHSEVADISVCLANLFLGILQRHPLLGVYWRFPSPRSMTFLCTSKERQTLPCSSLQKLVQVAIPGNDWCYWQSGGFPRLLSSKACCVVT